MAAEFPTLVLVVWVNLSNLVSHLQIISSQFWFTANFDIYCNRYANLGNLDSIH